MFVEPGDETRGFWAEPWHKDGGASIMHMGVTLYGRRRLECDQGFDRLRPVVIDNVPGTVYMGMLTGPRHQVTHMAASDGELLSVPGLGPCGVNVMARTSLFPFFQARLRNTTPAPQAVFHALARSLGDSLSRATFSMPTLSDMKAEATARESTSTYART